jgi:hypothetical protein
MNEKEFQELIKELNLSKTGIGWTIPGDLNRKDVEIFIRKHFFESEAIKKITILESKIFVYEQIISKSNFSQMVINDKLKSSDGYDAIS